MSLTKALLLGALIGLALICTKKIYAIELTPVSHERKNGYQRLLFKKNRDTTQYLIVTKSHGDPGDISKKPSFVRGGKWIRLERVGNDDKGIEIWWRYYEGGIGNGRLDTRRGKANVSVISFDGFLSPGEIAGRKLLSPQRPTVTNDATGPFLVVIATDNHTKSKNAAYSYGPRDDKTLIYYTADQEFKDDSVGLVRGAIISIQLL